jgi:hypothetical protein
LQPAKEKSMQYKTIVLQLLKDRTQWYEQLRLARLVLPTLETLAAELKAGQEAWEQTLARLPPVSQPDNAEPIPLERAMAFLKSHTSSG